ncbi:DNA-directed RNA polymerases I, II, and III subunit RPABC3 [Phlyctochytrium planicorne]|nr:DNA-directed RNA polymerases I, II, and III subunit RPABC3 [Phlyctochytrium planicorne]
MQAEIFTDIFEVNDVDKAGKKFDRVSRLNATSEATDMVLILDINSEVCPPLKVADKFTLLLANSLMPDGSGMEEGREPWRDFGSKRTLADEYEYVMFGKVYKFDENVGKDEAAFYASFGGLLMCMTGDPSQIQKVHLGQELFLLLRKNS